MAQYRALAVVDAVQWNKLGDHEKVSACTATHAPERCSICRNRYKAHGVLDRHALPAVVVCPGDWIIDAAIPRVMSNKRFRAAYEVDNLSSMPTIVFGAKCKGKLTEMAARIVDDVPNATMVRHPTEIEWMIRYDGKPYGARLPYEPDDENAFVDAVMNCVQHAGITVAALDAARENKGEAQWVIAGSASGKQQYLAIDPNDGDLVAVEDVGEAVHFASEKEATDAIAGCEWGEWTTMESPLFLMPPPPDAAREEEPS